MDVKVTLSLTCTTDPIFFTFHIPILVYIFLFRSGSDCLYDAGFVSNVSTSTIIHVAFRWPTDESLGLILSPQLTGWRRCLRAGGQNISLEKPSLWSKANIWVQTQFCPALVLWHSLSTTSLNLFSHLENGMWGRIKWDDIFKHLTWCPKQSFFSVDIDSLPFFTFLFSLPSWWGSVRQRLALGLLRSGFIPGPLWKRMEMSRGREASKT